MAPLTLRRAGVEDDFAGILALVQACFAYMEERIDPPSSMHRLTVESVRAHALTEEIWLAEDEAGALAACVFFTVKRDGTGTPGRLYLGKMAVRPDCRGEWHRASHDREGQRAGGRFGFAAPGTGGPDRTGGEPPDIRTLRLCQNGREGPSVL